MTLETQHYTNFKKFLKKICQKVVEDENERFRWPKKKIAKIVAEKFSFIDFDNKMMQNSKLI